MKPWHKILDILSFFFFFFFSFVVHVHALWTFLRNTKIFLHMRSTDVLANNILLNIAR